MNETKTTCATWGQRFRVTIFGESHGVGVGVVIDGVPPGMRLDVQRIRAALARRAPGNAETATARRETDDFEILSGVLDGVTTGAPLAAFTRNQNAHPGDYTGDIPRPGHADYPAFVKYGGQNDGRGGGYFSGRMTAALVFAGSVAAQYLAEAYGIAITSETRAIHGKTAPEAMPAEILAAKARGDSVGGVIACRARGVPTGWGAPMFGNLEGVIASIVFAVPAVKGVAFGAGFGFAEALGSEVSDGMAYGPDGAVTFSANHNGGVVGGLSTGNDIVFSVAIKPTPTIFTQQSTINLATHMSITHAFAGRHDPCIVPRAGVIIESALAIALMEVREHG